MPPLTEVAEAVAFADASETVVVCVRIGHTRRDKLAELRDLLARRGVVPLGFFVTSRRRAPRSDKHGYQGYPGELPLIPGDYLLSPEQPQPSAENP
jgi:Mrp family chromosome partitioning ATPase